MIPTIPHRQVELKNILVWVCGLPLEDAKEGATLTLQTYGAPCGRQYEDNVAKEMATFLGWFNENLAEHFQELEVTEVEYDGYQGWFNVTIVCNVKEGWA